ncbi:hypothetical protein N8T08_005879 [Aspergillus melleus]|uniref:Uncharacterized protein n=1 Tax=Aspergillus melleus TaxID=138277 RepID=A0ACC3B1D3_9EURO|nr:hypothetical protein N8T08_005879 [Aspergillus melleus]
MEFLTGIETNFADMNNTTRDGNKLIRFIPCPSNGPLCFDVEWDIWKISRVDSHDMAFGRDFYWIPPVPYNQLYWLNPRLFYDWPRHSDFATQRQRFMTYIPLRGEGRLYGLTAFCSNRGFVGLGTHFDSRPHSAVPYQSSVYWTIKNRIFFLGPHFPQSYTVFRSIFTPDDGEIHGLYYDMTPGISGIKSLGAICRPYGSMAEQKHNQHQSIPEMPPTQGVISLLRTSPFTSFTSQAYLKDIASVKACSTGSRCTGMLLCYNSDERCFLGQWYDNTEVQADIQEMSLQSCDALRFYFTHQDNRPRLISVKARSATAPVETGVMFVDIVYGEEIGWMFSGQSDLIFCGSD